MAQEQRQRTNSKGELKTYTLQYGKDEQGQWVPIKLTHHEPDDFSGQPKDLTFKSLLMESDREGNVIITTSFYEDQYTPNGLLSLSYCREISERTRSDEASNFFDMLRGMLEKNVLNLLAAGGSGEESGFLGHPYNRFFNAQGQPNPDEDIHALPTFSYHTPAAPVNDDEAQ